MIKATCLRDIRRGFIRNLSQTEEFELRNGEVVKIESRDVELLSNWELALRERGSSHVASIHDLEEVALNNRDDLQFVVRLLKSRPIGKLSLPDLLALRKKLQDIRKYGHTVFTEDGQGMLFNT